MGKRFYLGEMEFCAMDDVDRVRKRRAEVGLPTLASYAKRNGFKMK